MKNGAVLAGALALAVSTGANAQSATASGLLRQIGGALSGKSGSQAKVSHPLYAEPAGIYWDLDEDTLVGAQHLREGLSSTGHKESTCATWGCWPWPIPPTSCGLTNGSGACGKRG